MECGVSITTSVFCKKILRLAEFYRFLIKRAGFPAHTSFDGISFVTIAPAPTIAPSPIVTGLTTIVPMPM